MEQSELRAKMAKIEALFAGTSFDGERDAAKQALDRMLSKLQEEQKRDSLTEHKYTGFNTYSKKLFLALLRRYGLEPYRYYRQKYTTVMVKGPHHFLTEVVWPEFLELNKVLTSHLSDITDRIIAENICSSTEDEKEIAQLND